jgi:excisionase family DNA binding protein
MRKRSRRTTEIEMEIQELSLVRGSKPVTAWCPGCARESVMSSPEEAARLAGVSVRAIYRWVEAGAIHFTETREGVTLICVASSTRPEIPAQHGASRPNNNSGDGGP